MSRLGAFIHLAAACSIFLCMPAPGSDRAAAKPVILVVGYAPGGSVDFVARAIAPALAKRLGRPVNVENIAGASGMIAAAKVALADPDGDTLLVGSPSEIGINSALDKRIRFDPVKETTPIVLIGSQSMVLVAGKQAPVTELSKFLDHAQKRGSSVRFASSGNGTPLHLAGELINQRGGLRMSHVPYAGAGPMVADLLEGRVDYAVMVLSSALPYLKDRRLTALGLTEATRSAIAPHIPSLSENQHLRGVDMGVWFGLLGPARMPSAIASQRRAELLQVLAAPEVRAKLEGGGIRLMEEVDFASFLAGQVQRFKVLIDSAGAGR